MNEHKFDGMGRIYKQFRPSYPQAFLAYIFSEIGLPKSAVFADVGAGTGILTRQLLEIGNTVYAVEPNDDMRAQSEMDLKHFPSFIAVRGTAEDTKLQSNSVDCVTAAQAFHWFDRARFQMECRRILKENGKVVLVWNSRDVDSALVQENDRINRIYCPNFKGFSGGMRGAMHGDDFADFFSGTYEEKAFLHPLKMDKQGFIGRNLSASYALKPTDRAYSAYVSALESLFSDFAQDGFVTMPNITKCYVGKV